MEKVEDWVTFFSSFQIDARGCWVWREPRTELGYGYWKRVSATRPYRQTFSAHRVSYRFFVGEPPAGMVLDHLCRNRACCNPRHLEPVTHTENLLRGHAAHVLSWRPHPGPPRPKRKKAPPKVPKQARVKKVKPPPVVWTGTCPYGHPRGGPGKLYNGCRECYIIVRRADLWEKRALNASGGSSTCFL